MRRHLLLGAAALLFLWGVAVAVTGGIDVRVAGFALRSRDPFRALVASLALVLIAALVYRAEVTSLFDRTGALARRYAAVVALAAAAALAVHGIVFGSFTAGGSDAYGYVNQAYDWAAGTLPRPIPLRLSLPFPASDTMQAPLGYRVGTGPQTMVPTYAPGLPLLMALSLMIGACGPFFVVPIFAALFVWFTFRLGTLAGGRGVGMIAVVVLVTSPVVLYQTLWPMSDIPAGALWTAAFVYALGGSRRSAAASGGWAAVGVLVRPNLLFAPAVPLLLIAFAAVGRERWVRAAMFCLPLVPVAVFVAVLNTVWYGAPSNSGYGAAREIYLLSNVVPNLKLYSTWLWESQSPWALVGVVAFLPPFNRYLQRRAIVACAFAVIGTLASYLSYSQFELWWYLRFLMPAFGAFAVIVAAGLVAIIRAVPQPFGKLIGAVALFVMSATTLAFAAGKGVFGPVRSGERRYVDVGEFAAEHLPANAAFLAVQHSGSLRFYSGRVTLRFDSIGKEWAAGVTAALERAGYHPYLIVDDWEIPQVRAQFGFAEGAALPWPIAARMRELGGVTVFDMATSPAPVAPVAIEPGSRHWCGARARPAI